MKKVFGIFIGLIISCLTVFSADMRFVQVSEMMYNSKDKNSVEKTQNLINDINKLKKVEFVVFTGNNIAKPSQKNLEGFLTETKRLRVPYYVLIGNKDAYKQSDFGKKEYFNILSKKVKTHKKITSPSYVFEKKDVIFIVVDGSKDVIPDSMGYYRPETLKWLEEQLNIYKNKNVIILQHFPLIPPIKKENYYTFKPENYLKLLSEHNNVKAVISGHFGVNKELSVGDILHISTGSAPTYRIIDILNYDTKQPSFWSICR